MDSKLTNQQIDQSGYSAAMQVSNYMGSRTKMSTQNYFLFVSDPILIYEGWMTTGWQQHSELVCLTSNINIVCQEERFEGSNIKIQAQIKILEPNIDLGHLTTESRDWLSQPNDNFFEQFQSLWLSILVALHVMQVYITLLGVLSLQIKTRTLSVQTLPKSDQRIKNLKSQISNL